MAKDKKVFMCDFETTTKEDDCRVWAACAVDMSTGDTAHLGTSIDGFMDWVEKTSPCKLYFHNLAFDGEFILSYLMMRGFEHVSHHTKAVPEGCFSTLIDANGQFYKIVICFKRKGKRIWRTEIYDSLKKIPGKVKNIAKDYGLPISKGEIDYNIERPIGYQITDEERDYIETDCRIVQKALSFQFEAGMEKMTIASEALSFYKQMMGNRFEYWFPELPVAVDNDIRPAYKGGVTMAMPHFADRDLGEGIVLDYNSHYPAAMYYNLLPYGYPHHFDGEYQPDERYPLYIQRLRCAFRVKPDHIPCIQIKGRGSVWQETEYLTSSEVTVDGHTELAEVDLTLTSVDLKLFFDQYDVYNPEYKGGFMFRGQHGMFKDYIDHWMRVKETSPKGSAQRAIAKLYLNSLYGKFASTTERRNKIPVLCPDDVVRYYCKYQPMRDRRGNIMFNRYGKIMYERDADGYAIEIEPDIEPPVYTPVAAFITAYARDKIIRNAQSVYHRFAYMDTDSLHLIGTDIPEGLEIHPTKLGALDLEKTFQRARFLRAKTYVEEVDGKLEVTCAGMPDNVKNQVTWDNFHNGMEYTGKLLPKRVRGGIVLVPVDFSIQI